MIGNERARFAATSCARISAVTAKEAALKDTAALRTAAERLDPKDAIASDGKASKEQALSESAAIVELEKSKAAQEFQPITPDVSLADLALLDSQGQDTDQDSAADLLLSPGTSGSRTITFDDVLATMPEETGDFFIDNFPSQGSSIRSSSSGGSGGNSISSSSGGGSSSDSSYAGGSGGGDSQTSPGSSSPPVDWDTIRTLMGLPESEFDSDAPPPSKDYSLIADGTQAGTAPVNVIVGKDGEVKGGGKTSDDPFLNAASNAITGQIGNTRDAWTRRSRTRTASAPPPPAPRSTTARRRTARRWFMMPVPMRTATRQP